MFFYFYEKKTFFFLFSFFSFSLSELGDENNLQNILVVVESVVVVVVESVVVVVVGLKVGGFKHFVIVVTRPSIFITIIIMMSMLYKY